ncbi:hypothetical protein [Helicobacter mehlei]|uniref:hypothetical protein n=1 Tax=Helicobacter mehlei TaxID=2316080 RepID=UPI000EB02F97|nr:hypothetical protein [Helicobacter mehlei]
MSTIERGFKAPPRALANSALAFNSANPFYSFNTNTTPAPNFNPLSGNFNDGTPGGVNYANWAKATNGPRALGKSGLKFTGRWGFNTSDLETAPSAPTGIPNAPSAPSIPQLSFSNTLGAVGLGIQGLNALAGIVGLGYSIFATNKQLEMARNNQKLAQKQFEAENARYNAREAERIKANEQIAASALPMQRE